MPRTGRPKGEPTRSIKVTISEKRAQEFEAEVERLNSVGPDKLTLSTFLAFKLDPPRATRAATRRATFSDPKVCPHPVGRRIGNQCAQCGSKVGK